MFTDNLTNTSGKVSFKTVKKDPLGVKMYTLSNGLRLFLSVNKAEPRIYTEIAVRAGSKHDPADTTGLAHYFEHMMFKGTDQLGSLDWAQEKMLLDRIEQRFEEHRREQDPEKKRQLYAEIDALSFEAAKFAAANEYDKLVSAMGAKGTNAYTWVEQTVYVNDIPSNEVERWFALESERFRRPVLRLFHTELETVFEEYNISQDRDFRKVSKAWAEILTPSHPYGTQTTLGRGEDLKNPSQTNIYRFFEQYYVPNNMAIIMAGDFDPDQVVQLAERYFGQSQPRKLPPFKPEPQPELSARTQRDVYGTESPWVELVWRFPGANSADTLALPMLTGLLHNYQAGLFDLNLMQRQQLLEVYAYPRIHEDHAYLVLHGKPREGQSLEAVEKLLLEEVQKLTRGEFEDWLPEAVIKDMKFTETRDFEKNQGRAALITSSYVLGVEWPDVVKRWDKLSALSKADLVDLAKRYLRDNNYAAIYKHIGEDASVMKVEKPPITPIEVNRADASAYAQQFLSKATPDIQPEFVDFKKAIKNTKLAPGITLRSIQDKNSRIFRLSYNIEIGKSSDKRLSILAQYLQFLGTSKYSSTQMQQAFYRIGSHFSVNCYDDHFSITLSGLEESFSEALSLMEHLLSDAQPNPEALQNLVADILLRRENDKLDKRTVLTQALASYAKYGPLSPFSDKLSKEALEALQPAELTNLLHSLRQYRHEVFYLGPLRVAQVTEQLRAQHVPAGLNLIAAPKGKRYPERDTKRNAVLFVDFPMVQVDLMLLSKGTPQFDLEEYTMSEWYNQYFGYGLSSIVFQEIRESKALAYSAYTFAASPQKKRNAHFLQAYVGTQPDKLRDAVEAFEQILEDMPVSLPQIEYARQSVLKQIAGSRIAKSDLFWSWRSNKQRGFLNEDIRQAVYNRLQNATAEDLIRFQRERIKGRNYTWLIMGERKRINFQYLRRVGPVKTLKLEQIFGY